MFVLFKASLFWKICPGFSSSSQGVKPHVTVCTTANTLPEVRWGHHIHVLSPDEAPGSGWTHSKKPPSQIDYRSQIDVLSCDLPQSTKRKIHSYPTGAYFTVGPLTCVFHSDNVLCFHMEILPNLELFADVGNYFLIISYRLCVHFASYNILHKDIYI